MNGLQQTIQCSRCHKRFFENGYKVNRLGVRLKTCLECNARAVAENARRTRCPHGRHTRARCRECGGASICIHDRRRDDCRACGGVSICNHDIQRNKCWTCDPAGALWHRANCRIRDAIGTEARAGRSTEELLGCDKETFFQHIEAQFTGAMGWARIAEIQIDHRTPIEFPGAAGGPPTLDEKVARLHYLNNQPLWTPDNRLKGNRWADPLPAAEAPPQPEPAPERPKPPTLTDDELADLLADVL